MPGDFIVLAQQSFEWSPLSRLKILRSPIRNCAEKAYKLHLQQLLAEYDLAMEQLQVIEDEVAAALARIPLVKPILAMKGMSTLAVAGILGEAGDLSGYAHGHALLRHAGSIRYAVFLL